MMNGLIPVDVQFINRIAFRSSMTKVIELVKLHGRDYSRILVELGKVETDELLLKI